MFMLIGVFASQAVAQVAILDNLAGKGVKVAAMDTDQMKQETAKGGYYYLTGSNGGTWNFYKNGSKVDTKSEFIVSSSRLGNPSSGSFDYYYREGSGSLLWVYNSTTSTVASSVSGPIVYWASYGRGGFGYVRNTGLGNPEVRNLPRLGSGSRNWNL